MSGKPDATPSAAGARAQAGGGAPLGSAGRPTTMASGAGASASIAGKSGTVGPASAGTAAAAGSGGVTSTAGTTAAGSGAPAAQDAGVETDAAMPMGGDMDRCDVGVLDPMAPPRALELRGDLGTHDPVVIVQDDVFYEHQTGPRVPGKTSRDLMSWEGAPSALGGRNPDWVAREVPEARDLWAPDLSFFGGKYHLYYSASSFGSNSSCIGHATRDSMKEGAWADQGPVVCSNHGSRDDWNAIDPNAIMDRDGKAYLFFGSFWDGIKVIELNADGSRSGNALHSVASRQGGAIEAPFVVRRCGYYYLFVSFDKCCNGAMSTYNIRVGRSDKVLGPYKDKSGKALLEGGGTELVKSGGSWRGPGHNAILFHGKKAYNIYHAYRSDNGNSTLRISELAWDADGWPVSGGP
jgi:arabinan endo-1,5-alpha-L-arabinosidase